MRIPYHIPHISQVALTRTLERLHRTPFLDFEVHRKLEEHLAAPHQRAWRFTDSCTDALELAALALGVGPGDEVIMPSYTYAGTANAFTKFGATIRFADVEPDCLGLDPKSVQEKLSERTKAIVPVHYAGMAADLDALVSLLGDSWPGDSAGGDATAGTTADASADVAIHAAAGSPRIALIEDAAQGLGSTYRGRPLGVHGDFGAVSFHHTKNITTFGRGGMLYLKPHFQETVDQCAAQGTNRSDFLRGAVPSYEWLRPGGNYGSSSAALYSLYEQLPEIQAVTTARRSLFHRYREALRDMSERGVVRIPNPRENAEVNGHIFFLIWPSRALRDRYIAAMAEREIEVIPHYTALHRSPAHRDGPSESLPVTELADDGLVRIPLRPSLLESEIEEILEQTRRFARNLL